MRSSLPEVRVDIEGAIGRVIVSNPSRLNAMTVDMWRALPVALKRLDDDSGVRLIVIEGDGERAFISGGDITEFESQRADASTQAAYDQAVEAAYRAPPACSKPVVAKIRGTCMGGGLGLAAACDVRFSNTEARFRMPAGRLGLGYSETGVRRFVSVLGLQNTLDIFFSARVFDAEDALRMGFVIAASPPSEFDQRFAEWCSRAAENAPLTLRALKLAAEYVACGGRERDLAAVESAIAACFSSEDYREGTRAFMEKRSPVFRGR